jgi:uncharacterized protein YdaU (DUF1376 family)
MANSTNDPAFLFYSKDFYEGTRTMLPSERACYIDLLIYQHQNGGFIPDNKDRILLYCNGIDKATLEATLEAKFKLTDSGWVNYKLKKVMEEREQFSGKQSTNGIFGQFLKKAKNSVSNKIYKELYKFITDNNKRDLIVTSIKNNEATHEAMLEAMLNLMEAKLKHLEDANVIKDVDSYYKDEIEKNCNALKIEQYKKFVNILFGDNEIGEKLKVLQLKGQVSYNNFLSLNEDRERLQMEGKNVSFTKALLKLENRPSTLKDYTDLFLTLKNYITYE